MLSTTLEGVLSDERDQTSKLVPQELADDHNRALRWLLANDGKLAAKRVGPGWEVCAWVGRTVARAQSPTANPHVLAQWELAAIEALKRLLHGG